MKKIIRLTESDLVKLVKRILSEQPIPTPVVSDKTRVQLPKKDLPQKPDLFSEKSCLKDFKWDYQGEYYHKDQYPHDGRRLFKNGTFEMEDIMVVGGFGGIDVTNKGTWKCYGQSVLYDRPGTEIGKDISLDNGDFFSDSSGGYSIGGNGHQQFAGKIISKTPKPQENGYELKIKGDGYSALSKAGPNKDGKGCVRVSTNVLHGNTIYEVPSINIEAC